MRRRLNKSGHSAVLFLSAMGFLKHSAAGAILFVEVIMQEIFRMSINRRKRSCQVWATWAVDQGYLLRKRDKPERAK